MVAGALLLQLSHAAAATIYRVNSVAQLRTFSGNTGDLAIAPGYYFDGDRGGGQFVWNGSANAPDDGGLFIAPNSGTSGRWVRTINEGSPNIRMWGAKGDVNIDTIAIQNAVNACSNWWYNGLVISNTWYQGLMPSSELAVPAGYYLITNTIVFPPNLHIVGENGLNACMIEMIGTGRDMFRTSTANNVLRNGSATAQDFDHGVLFERLYLRLNTNDTTSAGLVLCKVGEASTIRNLVMVGGGYGIRCFGTGGPGLTLENVSIFDVEVANVSLEGYLPNGAYVAAWPEPVTLNRLSGDHRRPSSDATACFVRVDRCCPILALRDFKAEGTFGGGLVSMNVVATTSPQESVGSVTVSGGEYGCDGVNCDLVVLKTEPGGIRVPSVKVDQVNISGVRYLIRDELSPRNVYPDGMQLNGRLPVQYEAYTNAVEGVRSRLIIGENAVYDFLPPTNGWYRVMRELVGRLNGRLVVSSYNESSELNVDTITLADMSGGAKINVTRASRDSGQYQRPCVTAARTGTYWDPATSGIKAFLDIYVERTITNGTIYDQRISVTHPLDGLSRLAPHVGKTQLMCPTMPLTSILPATNCVLYQCVTNSLIR